MSCSRRDFVSGAGALIAVAGTTGLATSSLGLAAETEQKTIRYAMVHDEQICIGCTACMDACRETNNVPEGVARLEMIKSAPKGEFPNVRYDFFRQSCQHCTNAPCVSVCPTGASYIDITNGIVDVKPDLCVGCQYCVAVCPYRVRYIDPVKKTADKCNFCRDTNLAAGKQPACVEACPVKALTFGDVNDPNSAVSIKIRENETYRTKTRLGTEPNLYHIPRKYEEAAQ